MCVSCLKIIFNITAQRTKIRFLHTRGPLLHSCTLTNVFVYMCASLCVCVCRCNSFMGNSAVQKKPQSKPKKPHLSGHKGGSSSREPQPKRLEEVYTALKQGLE